MTKAEESEIDARRQQLMKWLLKVWEWADDNHHPAAAEDAAQLISHADEPDYPLFEQAGRLGLTGDGPLADKLRKACGTPVKGAVASPWEREINYSPVITLEEPAWRAIHGALGWVNRDHDVHLGRPSFWLWSNAANVVRFVMKEK